MQAHSEQFTPHTILNIGSDGIWWASYAFKKEIHNCGDTICLRNSQGF